jgi:hypothetical protein
MNLQNLVSNVISAVNPQTNCTVKVSIGNTQLPDGTRKPNYRSYPNIPCQIQALSGSDLRKMDGLNLQGIYRAAYLTGNVGGLDRAALKGGDLFILPDQTEWLVTQVLEPWSTWTKVAICKQNEG